MNCCVLTTDTLHHRFFVRELSATHAVTRIVVETDGPSAPYPTHHQFEDRRESYERETGFGGETPPAFEDLASTVFAASVNTDVVVGLVAASRPDVVLVFGTGRIDPPLIERCRGRILNLHGGDPEMYRGLDTHLWAVWHGDFDGLVTTLHHVNERLDDGDCLARAPVPLSRGMELHQLRLANTRVCVDLCRDALDGFAETRRFPATKQRCRGRYYSFMPAALKDACVARMKKHTATL